MSGSFDILNAAPSQSDTASDEGTAALRERAAGALEAAYGFVEREGHEFSRLRARILVQVEGVERGVEAIDEQVGAEGRPGRMGQVLPPMLEALFTDEAENDATRFTGTLEVLSVLADWGRLYEPAGDRIVAALLAAQEEDGSFGPANVAGEEPIGRVVATALTAGFLGRMRSARPEMLRGAGAFLAQHWSVDTIRGHGWPAVAGFAHYFTNVYDDEREAALPWCGRELERGWLAHEYTPADVMRVLFYCEASAIPGVSFDANALLTQLFDGQLDDGSVGEPASQPAARVAGTLDAMHYILRVCNSPGQ
ncbi:MAG: hypothetical protein QF570_22330 [Myxococcota bacterium]|jgi:hypothetical protein|nr:hypothetical protein [Myxococcota bacterium]